MFRKSAGYGLLLIACLFPVEDGRAQSTPDPWYARQVPPRNIDPPKVFTGAFSIELPRNWQLAPGHTGTLFSVVERTDRFQVAGLVTLEYHRLEIPLDPSLMGTVTERLLSEVRARELNGKQFTGTVKTGPLGPFVFIQYLRPGIAGRDDHVVQYSFPVGTTMYKLICIAPAASVEKYRQLFAHVAASFTPVKPKG